MPHVVAAESISLVAPCTGASLELVWRVAGKRDGARVLGGAEARATVAARMGYDGIELGDLGPWLRYAGTRRRASR